jgi:RHS repeat-associated protein
MTKNLQDLRKLKREYLFDAGTGGNMVRKTVTYYHQGDGDNTMPIVNVSQSTLGETTDTRSKMGRVFRSEVYDNSNNLLQTDITRWGSTQIAGTSYFVYPLSTLSQTFDTSGTHKDTGHTYTYNTTTGDLLVDINHGFVTGNTDGTYTDTGTDTKTVAYSYVTNTITGVDTVKQILVTNASGTTVAHEQYAFDGLGYGNVTKGNKTKIATLRAGSTYAYQYITYNPYGMPLTQKDPNGNITTTVYDTNTLYPATITNPLGHITTFVTDPTIGQPTKIIDPNGATTVYTYDGLGRRLTTTGPDSSGAPVLLESYTYDDTPLQSSVTKTTYFSNTLTNTSISYLDSFGREIQHAVKQGSQSIKTDTVYSPIGLIEKKSFPYTDSTLTKTPPQTNTAYYTTMTYDALGRILTQTTVSGTITHTYPLYVESVIDREGHKKDYTMDASGNLTTVVEYLGTTPYTTTYQYDTNNNLIKITDAVGNIRTFTYDSNGKRLSATDLHAPTDSTFGTYFYTYDVNGNMTSMTNPGGTVISYQYNALNQQTREDSASTPGIIDIAYTYNTCTNGKGKLCSVTRMVEVFPAGTSTIVPQITMYTYDQVGNTLSETLTYGTGLPALTTVSTYARQHQVLTQKNPDNITLTYAYNDQGQPSQITKTIAGVTTPVITSATYAPTGALASVVYPNTVTLTNTYDPLAEYRLTSKNAIRGTAYVQKLTYTYSPMGNITTLVDTSNTGTAKTTAFLYDDLYRLTKATALTTAGAQIFNETYTYDILGNMTTKNGTVYKYLGNTGTLTANPHAPTQIGAQSRTYDTLGNVIADGVHTNLFNYRNELLSTTKAGTISRSTYDHTGGRVSDTTGTKSTYTPTKGYTQERTGGTLSKQTTTVYLGDSQVAFFDTVGTNVTPNYVMTDHLGSTEKVTNQAGTLTSITDYYPYGAQRSQTGPQPKRAFIGEQYDTGSGYNYLNARYYHGDTGQFISQDSMFWQLPKELLKDPQQQNSYSYARDNPIMQKDPSGKCIWDACIVEALAVGAVVGAVVGYFGNPKIANAPAENSQVYASPSESEINANIAISTYTGSMTFGAAALEINAMKPAIIGRGQVVSQQPKLGVLPSQTSTLPTIARNNLPGNVQSTIAHLEENGFSKAPAGYKGGWGI